MFCKNLVQLNCRTFSKFISHKNFKKLFLFASIFILFIPPTYALEITSYEITSIGGSTSSNAFNLNVCSEPLGSDKIDATLSLFSGFCYVISTMSSGIAPVPLAPTQVFTKPMNTKVELFWTPGDNNGFRYIDYVIEYRISGSWITLSDGTSPEASAVVEGLSNDVEYEFRVRGKNLAGLGAVSTPVTATPEPIRSDGTVGTFQKISDNSGGFSGALSDFDFFGTSIVKIGDLDSDGIEDFAVGAENDDDGGTDTGAVWILFMNTNGSVKSQQKISDTAGGFEGPLDSGVKFGSSVALLGDSDGDGIQDIVVGAQQDDDGGDGHGAVWVLFLNRDGTVKAHQKISDTEGGFTGSIDDSEYFGSSVVNAGDMNGDGVIDILVGAEQDDADSNGNPEGSLWALFLFYNGTVKSSQKIGIGNSGFTGTLDDSDFFGTSIANIGDLDGDNIDDFAAGARQDDDGGENRGAVWILFMNAGGTVKSQQKISDTAGGFTAVLANNDQFGSSVTALGDLNGDGVADLVVGAFNDADGGAGTGAVYVLFMNADGTVSSFKKISENSGDFTTLQDGGQFGFSITNAGDLNNDGLSDLIVGANGNDGGGTDRGAIYTIFLKSGKEPAAPTVYAKPGNQRVDLYWTPGSNNGFPYTDYVVEFKVVTATAYTTFADGTGSTPSTIVTGLTNKVSYDFRVSGSNLLGTGTPSTPVSKFPSIILSDGDIGSIITLESGSNGFPTTVSTGTGFGSLLNEVGDLNGDGVIALVVGASGDDTGGTNRGAFWVLFMNSNGTINSNVKIANGLNGGPTLTNGAGFAYPDGIGDLNGDGILDIAVGAPGEDAIYVLFMNSDGTVNSFKQLANGVNGLSITTGQQFGITVEGIVDLDSDGVNDIAVGAYQNNVGGTNRGAIHILFMNSDGTVKSSAIIADSTGGGPTLINEEGFGRSISTLGDLDGDGVVDLAVGASGQDGTEDIKGSVYILLMNTNGSVKSTTKISNPINGGPTLATDDGFGDGVSVTGDYDGDGIPELIVSASQRHSTGTEKGKIYILNMNSDGTVKSHTIIGDSTGGGPALSNDDEFGFSVSSLIDINNDGLHDVIVSAPGDDTGGTDKGGTLCFVN